MSELRIDRAPRLVAISDAADFLHCNPRTVRRMIGRGDITGYRVASRMLRVDLNEVASLLRPIAAEENA